MVEPEESKAIEKGMRTLWFVWGAMLGSLLIYILLCHQLGGPIMKRTEGSAVPVELLRYVLASVGIVDLFLASYMKRHILLTQADRQQVKSFVRIRIVALKNTSPLVNKYVAAVIVSLALAESIGIYGLVLFLLGDSFQTLYTFIGASAFAMVFYRPKKEELEKLAMVYNKQLGTTPEI